MCTIGFQMQCFLLMYLNVYSGFPNAMLRPPNNIFNVFIFSARSFSGKFGSKAWKKLEPRIFILSAPPLPQTFARLTYNNLAFVLSIICLYLRSFIRDIQRYFQKFKNIVSTPPYFFFIMWIGLSFLNKNNLQKLMLKM